LIVQRFHDFLLNNWFFNSHCVNFCMSSSPPNFYSSFSTYFSFFSNLILLWFVCVTGSTKLFCDSRLFGTHSVWRIQNT
jgi:uncharacterized membrane protein YhaH (DUF805 family)